ncbi:hypothetical protein LX81_02258 [Palleronia aestuarii]|uniref:Uncharacterized protein n=2 Tax=Palleronia aestuarii TaxID=568105 RepID=A0A2W7N7E6_9RHOB|nr:hypothetical protein LX81_02258 [Palleronia aestuarii]
MSGGATPLRLEPDNRIEATRATEAGPLRLMPSKNGVPSLDDRVARLQAAIDAAPQDNVTSEPSHVAYPVTVSPTSAGESGTAPLRREEDPALEQMIADIVRQELRGIMGERLTRNLRQMVQREVRRSLAFRDSE